MKQLLFSSLLLFIITGCGSETNIYSSTESVEISDYYLSPNPVPAKASTYFNFYVSHVSDPKKISSIMVKIISGGVTTREYEVLLTIPISYNGGWLSVANPVTFMSAGTHGLAIRIKMDDGALSNELLAILISI